MNKKAIITILLAFVAMVGISNAFDFGIDNEDVTIVVNKDVAGNDIPDEKTAVGEATLAVRFLETEGGHVAPARRVSHVLLQSFLEISGMRKMEVITLFN